MEVQWKARVLWHKIIASFILSNDLIAASCVSHYMAKRFNVWYIHSIVLSR